MKVHQEKCGVKLTTECDICKKSFKSHGNMLIHKRRGHSQRKDYACEICNEEFPFEKWLKAHRKFHNKIENEIYECEICNKTFNLIHSLNTHRNTHFRKNKNEFQSQITTFTSEVELQTQEISIVMETNILKCGICGKWFGKRSALLNHFSIFHQSSIKCTLNVLGWYQ